MFCMAKKNRAAWAMSKRLSLVVIQMPARLRTSPAPLPKRKSYFRFAVFLAAFFLGDFLTAFLAAFFLATLCVLR
jgi:hypothetical protein